MALTRVWHASERDDIDIYIFGWIGMREGAIKEASIEFIADPRTALCPITNSASGYQPSRLDRAIQTCWSLRGGGDRDNPPLRKYLFQRRGKKPKSSFRVAFPIPSFVFLLESELSPGWKDLVTFPQMIFCTTIANMRNISKWRISECIWETKNRPIFESSSVAFLISRRRFKSKGAKESSPSLFNDVRFFPSFVELVHWALSWTNNVHLSRRRIEITHFSTENVENCLL